MFLECNQKSEVDDMKKKIKMFKPTNKIVYIFKQGLAVTSTQLLFCSAWFSVITESEKLLLF